MGKAREHLDNYVEMAEDNGPEGMTWESALDISRSGKYVDILFCTGGPHFEVQLEYVDDEDGEFWFENDPVGGVAHYADWGEADFCGISVPEARLIAAGVMRDPDDLEDEDDEDDDEPDGGDV